MSMRGDDSSLPSVDIRRQQIKILGQLFRMMPTFNHIDELFQWLAYTIVQQSNTQLIQFWANQIDDMGQYTMQLRAMVRQNTSIPEPPVVSDDVALIAQRIVYEQHIYNPQTIDNQFSQYRASVLRRYGLNFFAAFSIYANLLLPPMSNASPASMPTPLAMTIMLFLPQQPQFDLVPSIMTIMNQTMNVAGTHGLLLPTTRGLTTSRLSSGRVFPSLEDLIPHRKQNSSLMLSSNPLFGSTTVITDKSARRLYSAIDGQRDMATLCQHTGMSMSEASSALQILLTQQRVEVREPSGMLIDAKFLVKDSQ
jgi:hypothetical protein